MHISRFFQFRLLSPRTLIFGITAFPCNFCVDFDQSGTAYPGVAGVSAADGKLMQIKAPRGWKSFDWPADPVR
jgi:hypothetical protein